MILFKKIFMVCFLFMSLTLSGWASLENCHTNMNKIEVSHTEAMPDCHSEMNNMNAPKNSDGFSCEHCGHCIPVVSLHSFEGIPSLYSKTMFDLSNTSYISSSHFFDTPPPRA